MPGAFHFLNYLPGVFALEIIHGLSAVWINERPPRKSELHAPFGGVRLQISNRGRLLVSEVSAGQ